MDGVQSVLALIRDHDLAKGRLRGVLHLLIAKTLTTPEGAVLSPGLTWRQLAAELKAARFDKKLVTELGADPDLLSPRDRERFWYSAIGMGQVESADAKSQAEQLLKLLKPLGVVEAVKK